MGSEPRTGWACLPRIPECLLRAEASRLGPNQKQGLRRRVPSPFHPEKSTFPQSHSPARGSISSLRPNKRSTSASGGPPLPPPPGHLLWGRGAGPRITTSRPRPTRNPQQPPEVGGERPGRAAHPTCLSKNPTCPPPSDPGLPGTPQPGPVLTWARVLAPVAQLRAASGEDRAQPTPQGPHAPGPISALRGLRA